MTNETRRSIWLAVLFVVIVGVVAVAFAAGFGVGGIAKGPA